MTIVDERVIVESLDVAGRRSLEIAMPGRPAILLAAGDGFSPAEPEFTVTVHGEDRTWPFSVAARRGATVAHAQEWEPPTRRFELRMTDMQRKVVNAYMEPLRRGRIDPATHREVAEVLAYHPNTAREALQEVWARIFAAGIPMPDVADKRVAVVEAVRLHRLLETDGDG